jgi:hypothetical protein
LIFFARFGIVLGVIMLNGTSILALINPSKVRYDLGAYTELLLGGIFLIVVSLSAVYIAGV